MISQNDLPSANTARGRTTGADPIKPKRRSANLTIEDVIADSELASQSTPLDAPPIPERPVTNEAASFDEIRDDRIRDYAYYLWKAAGEPAGREMEFWLTAESVFINDVAPDTAGTINLNEDASLPLIK